MAQSANTLAGKTTNIGTANREDILDLLVLLSPLETPFFTMLAKGEATATNHQWRTEALVAPSSNTNIQSYEGADPDYVAPPDRTSLSNTLQIFMNAFQVSRTQRRVKKAGIGDDLAHLLENKFKEHKRDIEYSIFKNTTGSSSDPRKMKGISQFIDAGAANTIAGGSVALTEANFNLAIQGAWQGGGDVDTVMCTGMVKRRISTYTASTTRFSDTGGSGQAKLVNKIDVYEADFGIVQMVANRWVVITAGSPNISDVFFLDSSKWRFDFLDTPHEEPLAKTGDADKRMVISEGCIVGLAPIHNATITSVKDDIA